MEVEIRKVKLEDAQQLLFLMKQISTETSYLSREPEEWNLSLSNEIGKISEVTRDDDTEWFVAVDNGKIIGITSICRPRNISRLKHRAVIGLCLLKEYWGKGIGGKLIDICIQWAKDKGIEQLELEVASTNARAKMLYKKYGFEEVYSLPNGMKYKDGSYVNLVGMIKKI